MKLISDWGNRHVTVSWRQLVVGLVVAAVLAFPVRWGYTWVKVRLEAAAQVYNFIYSELHDENGKALGTSRAIVLDQRVIAPAVAPPKK